MKICVINTGGTVGCVGDPLAPMSAADFAANSRRLLDPILLAMFPELEPSWETGLAFPESATGTLDSTNLQPRDWCLIARYILDNYERFDGFVLLHGTDSMDFTASALPFLLNAFDAQGTPKAALSKPVIVTGSQVPMYRRGSPDTLRFNTDAFQNLCGAVACARQAVPEVCVYFDARLFRGNRALKVNASDFCAFDSPNFEPLGTYGIALDLDRDLILPGPVSNAVSLAEPAVRAAAKARLDAIAGAIDDWPVMPFSAFPAAYDVGGGARIARLIDACVGTGIRGLVLRSYGEGNFPSGNPDRPADGAIYRALEAARRGGVTIVDSTQVIAGRVGSSAYAAGAWLPKIGAICAADMTPVAALAKLMILLAAADHEGWTRADVERLFQRDLCGEVTVAPLR
ncbi:asparaginase [Novosphingopyxis sp.]|uniref:asparaginase n=1 Tax=Novosphingopyxis sp. TaxID=2709690 RepID=UPI003B5B903D